MSLFDVVRYRLRTLFRSHDHSRELERELRFHLDLDAAQHRHDGVAPPEAELAARRAFGSITYVAEETRRAAGLAWLDVARQDLTWALRGVRRAPAFTVVAALTLALGVGATTAVFSVIEGVLLRPLSIARPDRVLSLRLTPITGRDDQRRDMASSLPQYVRWRSQLRSFSGMAAFTPTGAAPLGKRVWRERGAYDDVDTNSVLRTYVSASFFSFAGVTPLFGRDFTEADDRATSERTAILSFPYWRRAYGGDPHALGRAIVVDGDTYRIIGVMPREFLFPEETEIWTTIGPTYGSFATDERMRLFDVLGRLRDDATPAAALAELRAAYANDARSIEMLRRFAPSAPGVQALMVARIRAPLLIMMAFVGAVLLIAASNVTNMLLARGTTRQHELAIRLALGAGRWRVVRQQLTESLILALASTLIGVAAAMAIVRYIVAQSALDLPRRSLIGLSPLVVVACVVTAMVVGVLCGLVPALSLSRDALEGALRSGTAQLSASRRRRRLRDALVVAEVALAIVLLAGAGLLRKSFMGLLELRPGLTAERVLTADLALGAPSADSVARIAMAVAIAERLRATPGISSASVTSSFPFGGALEISPLSVPGVTLDSSARPFTLVTAIDGEYFRALGTRVVRGRAFAPADFVRHDVAIISDVLARKYLGGSDPIGRRIALRKKGGPTLEVIGVVESTRQQGLSLDPDPATYVPLGSAGASNLSIVVRADRGDLLALIPVIERVVKDAVPSARLENLTPLATLLDHTAARPRVYMLLLGGFAVVAMLLTAVGLYGVISYSVAQRTREIGIRIALGASPMRLHRRVVWQGLVLTLAGVVMGVVLALGTTRVLRSILYGVSPNDPAVLATVAGMLTLVAVAACWIPARRAANVDPMVAIRAD